MEKFICDQNRVTLSYFTLFIFKLKADNSGSKTLRYRSRYRSKPVTFDLY